uniref:SAG family member n=1 Tax=Eimeria tenella TaxID=5802 RepID=H9B9Z8_EIMTE|nr:hypothetical protein [Eimeria tenella]
MAGFWFLALASTLLLPRVSSSSEDDSIEVVDCMSELNKVRESVGLPKFSTFKDRTPNYGDEEANDDVALCSALEKGGDPHVSMPTLGVSLAAMVQEGETRDCAAAVRYWKDVYSQFGSSLPPPYEVGVKPYDDWRTVSFMALFTTQDDPAATCVNIKCPPRPSNEEEPTGPGVSGPPTTMRNPSQDGEGKSRVQASSPAAQTRRLAAQFRALLCIIDPVALTQGKAPFTESQWAKIRQVLQSSSPVVSPTFITLAAALLGISLI